MIMGDGNGNGSARAHCTMQFSLFIFHALLLILKQTPNTKPKCKCKQLNNTTIPGSRTLNSAGCGLILTTHASSLCRHLYWALKCIYIMGVMRQVGFTVPWPIMPQYISNATRNSELASVHVRSIALLSLPLASPSLSFLKGLVTRHCCL